MHRKSCGLFTEQNCTSNQAKGGKVGTADSPFCWLWKIIQFTYRYQKKTEPEKKTPTRVCVGENVLLKSLLGKKRIWGHHLTFHQQNYLGLLQNVGPQSLTQLVRLRLTTKRIITSHWKKYEKIVINRLIFPKRWTCNQKTTLPKTNSLPLKTAKTAPKGEGPSLPSTNFQERKCCREGTSFHTLKNYFSHPWTKGSLEFQSINHQLSPQKVRMWEGVTIEQTASPIPVLQLFFGIPLCRTPITQDTRCSWTASR